MMGLDTIALSLSCLGPLLEQIAKKTGSSLAKSAAKIAIALADYRPVYLFAATWWLTVATIALSFFVGLLSDDAMAKWVKKCSFRKAPQGDKDGTTPQEASLYAKPGDDYTELLNAFKTVSEAKAP